MLQTFQECLGDIERAFCHFCPEIEVHLRLGVLQRHIADDAEGDERRLVDVAGLGDGAALHIHGHGMRKVLQDGTHLLLAIHKPLAAYDLSGMNPRVLAVGQFVDGKCLLHILLWSLEGGWHAENLTVLALVAAVGIVVNAVGGYHHFGYIEVDIGTSGNA